ncbi:MAG: putative peptidase [Prokaryotic dsDNA virus sp.]|nr:MAG: putative peptidase [Prokaryotic dsDNA virus sp.]|tara:strand:+ start:2948 stop:3670 length:723 start_codon:yes stop_codon:yes gene_type:complete
MPCKKCENGKYKWGERGECQYDTKEECKQANPEQHYEEETKNTKIVELVISEDAQDLAIDAISLVSNPAIEENMVYMSKEKNNLTLAKVDEEKKEIISPALIPNKQIYRYDASTDSDYYVYFSPATVKEAAYLYLKNNNHHKATYEHQQRVSGVLTVESWIIEDPKKDKASLYGFSLPKGTWMVKMKVTNEDLWEEIKSGAVRGLSIEGYFTDKMETLSERQATDQEILSALLSIIKEIK